MIECTRGDIRDLLPELLHGRLDASARAEAERHVRACAECAEELELLRRAQGALSRVPAIDVSRITAAALRRGRAPVRTRWAMRNVAAIAAAVLLMLTGVMVVLSISDGDDTVAVRPDTPSLVPDDTGAAPVSPVVPDAPVVATAPVTSAPAPVVRPTPDEEPVSLAFGGGDLAESELESLLADIASLDGIPDADPGSVIPDIPVEVQ